MMASGVPWTQEELRQLRDSRTYTTFCKSHVFGACARRDREMTTDVKDSVISARRKYFRKEYRESFVELFSSIVGETSTDDAPPPPTSFPDTCRHGNKTSNENQEHCFSESTTRRIPLESFAQLCAPTETETQDKDEEREAVPLSKRKYIKYFRLDTNRDASHSSFRFLVDLMATHIETKPEVLEVTIMKMESLLLDD
ncbi:hypothetical protein QZH41_007096 [Actinostola sp. cb2023]|nr:hypothetical protein QZH41_007096 [Actinostola sp. cb2023]